MNATVFQVFFFLLIPVGVFILIKSIKLVRKTFSGAVILEIPYSRKSSVFEITKSGVYSIWHKGQIFRKAPLNQFKPQIHNDITKEEIKLTPSVFRLNSNNGYTGRMELFRFTAPAGKFKLDLTEGSSLSLIDRGIYRLFPLRMVDVENYFIQVRESQPIYYLLIGIILMALAGFLIIGGLVFGILSDQLFTN